MDRPSSEEIQPPLTWRGHAWRLAACGLISAVVWSTAIRDELESNRVLFGVEVVLGLVSYVLVSQRRRAPVMVAMVTALLSGFSAIATGPAILAAVSLATHRVAWSVTVVGLTNVATGAFYALFAPIRLREPVWVGVPIVVAVTVAVMAWGLYLGSRRELMWTLRQRITRAESEQELRLAQARSTERERIAREMHDVLAHRITQISMQAGALAFRDDLAADQLRRGLGEIQAKSNEAIHDLRGVLGVLRDAATGRLVDGPQPTYSEIAGLIAESRAHGVNVELIDRVDRSVEVVPDVVGRALYRIVQEGLTNSAKHAPGAHVSVELSGSPGHGIDVLVRNPLGFRAGSASGAGLGLVGLSERAALRGGTLVHGREGTQFVLRGSLPWTA